MTRCSETSRLWILQDMMKQYLVNGVYSRVDLLRYVRVSTLLRCVSRVLHGYSRHTGVNESDRCVKLRAVETHLCHACSESQTPVRTTHAQRTETLCVRVCVKRGPWPLDARGP